MSPPAAPVPAAPVPAAPVPAARFHGAGARVYDGDPGWAVTKRGAAMARVAYAPVHPNAAYDDARGGRGEAVVTWVFSETGDTAEGLFATPLAFVHDTRFAPGAAVGLHAHDHDEEVYYVLEGAVTMTTLGPDGRAHTATLGPGDAHAVRLGQRHYGEAGPDGCRLLVVAVRAAPPLRRSDEDAARPATPAAPGR